MSGKMYANGNRFDGLKESVDGQIPSHPTEMSSGKKTMAEHDTQGDPNELGGSKYPAQIGDGKR